MAKKEKTEPTTETKPNITFTEENGVVYATFVHGEYVAQGMGETVIEALIDLPKSMKDYV